MTCYHPLSAWQTDGGEIVFQERGSIRRSLILPCGQCRGCRLERSRQWATRCIHEAAMYDSSSFVTLTYNNDNCPVSLRYGDFQKFMRKLRKRHGKARFFMCGEYGDENSRPHFHACLFGVHFSDRVPISAVSGGPTLYRSSILERLWPHGFASVGDVTFESAAYVARYVMKKVNGDGAEEIKENGLRHYERVTVDGEIKELRPEFCQMSRRPGIGKPWFDKFCGDVFSDVKDGVRHHAARLRAPRFYDKLLAASNPDLADFIALRRYEKITPEVVLENSPERLAVREQVEAARLAFKSRDL